MAPALDPVLDDERVPAQADVVVIGAGIVGTFAAYYLACRGLTVALVEKGYVGAEQSSRNWGWCRQQGRDIAEIPISQHSLRLWETAQAEIGTDLGFRRTGVLFVSDDAAQIADWERWAARARDFQLHSYVLSGAEADAMMPGCAKRWKGGLHTPSDGVAEPSCAAPAVAEAARHLGTTIHQRCAARGLETAAGRVSAVLTEKGRIATGAVLCAGGAWSSLFFRHLGIPLPQAGVYATAFRTMPGPHITMGGIGTPGFAVRRRADGGYTVGLAGRGRVELTPQGLLYAKQFWPTYLKRRKNVRLSLGRSFIAGPEMLAHWGDDAISPFERMRILDPAPDRHLVGKALTQLRSTYPDAGLIGVAESWGGFIDTTPDAIPVISAVDRLPGLYVATGFSGHGFGLGPGAGHLAADLITGISPAIDPTPFAYTRLIDGRRLAPLSSF